MPDNPPSGCGQDHVTYINITFWGAGHIFGADEARHFNFGLQTERKKSTSITQVKVLQYRGAFKVT